MTTKELDARIEKLRAIYFPRWNKERKWKFRQGPRSTWLRDGVRLNSSERGWCDLDNKTIYISYASDQVILHEICHAVSDGGHEKKFMARYKKVAEKAKSIGDRGLSESIEKEIEIYKNSPKVCLTMLRYKVDDTLCDFPQISWKDAVLYLCYEYGLTPSQIDEDFSSLKNYFETKRKDMQRYYGRP